MKQTWTNWSGNISCHPQLLVTPTSEAELIKLMQQSASQHQKIRLVGTGHSFVPLCATDDILISLDKLQGLIRANRADLEATFWAGTKIHQMGEPLRVADMAMENMGDIDRQAIAGAISTGTHGTGQGIGNISSQVVGLRLITATGDVLDCSDKMEPDIFKAAQVSLGALGVISQVKLRLLPAYNLHEQTAIIPFQECFDHLPQLIATNRHFEFFWSSEKDACAIKRLNPTNLSPNTTPDATPRQTPLDNLARYTQEARIDYSYRIFPSERNNKFNEMEFAIPAEHGLDCLREIRALMQTKYTDIRWPLEYRTLGQDDIYLSPAYQRETVTISIHQAHNLPYHLFFSDAEAIFRNYQGRPHWGKIHNYTPQDLAASYPMWSHFQQIRQQLDPKRQFLNPYLQSLFGID